MTLEQKLREVESIARKAHYNSMSLAGFVFALSTVMIVSCIVMIFRDPKPAPKATPDVPRIAGAAFAAIETQNQIRARCRKQAHSASDYDHEMATREVDAMAELHAMAMQSLQDAMESK